MKIKKIDIPESTAIDTSVLWGGINDNVLAAKLNELIDVVNKQQDIIRQIGEWGSSKGECLWCDTLTEFNPEKPTISKMENVESSENVLTKSLRMDKEFAEEEMERLQKENSDLKDEVEKLQKQLAEWQNANVSLIKDSAICNTYTHIRWDELCRLREIADKYAEITGHKGGDNDIPAN